MVKIVAGGVKRDKRPKFSKSHWKIKNSVRIAMSAFSMFFVKFGTFHAARDIMTYITNKTLKVRISA